MKNAPKLSEKNKYQKQKDKLNSKGEYDCFFIYWRSKTEYA